MNTGWAQWMRALGGAEIVEQSEFTWERVTERNDGAAGWIFEVLDVAGTNGNGHEGRDVQPVSRRCDDVPFPNTSDHWPVGLRWHQRGRTRRATTQNGLVNRPIPQWLLRDEHFLAELDHWFRLWAVDRAGGFEGLDSFVRGENLFAVGFMRSNVVQAKTPEHKLDNALAVLRLLQQDSVDEARLSRLLAVDPSLQDIVYLDVNADLFVGNHVPDDVIAALRSRCRSLAEEVVVARLISQGPSDVAEPSVGSLHSQKLEPQMVQRLKAMKAGRRLTVEEVWDDQSGRYVSENDAMAEVLLRNARGRQGSPRGEDDAGQHFLDGWRADFRACRTALSLNEIEVILHDSPNGKRPGPDGVPSELLKRYAAQLAEVFQEAWEELQEDDFSDAMYRALAMKTWLVAPKSEGANRVEKFRDLELGNECRKVIARMLNKVLDEVCSLSGTGISSAQQAFVRGRDIVQNTSAMLGVYWENVGERQAHEDPLLMLLLDCSKGYNLLSRTWVVRVLRKAGLPDRLVKLVEKIMVNISILMLNGKEHELLELLAGLTQGCPASCFLYIIAIDPLLQAMQALEGVQIVSGFVDDWSAGCDGFEVLARVAALVKEFERASGQRINREKSAVVPSRRLVQHEVRRCFAEWGWELRVSYRERLLGIYVGIDAGIKDQYRDASEKFERTMAVFNAARSKLSIVARIVATNIFLNTLFAYQNRLFFMPAAVLREFEQQVLRFITPTPWLKLGFLSAIKDLYGISCELVDLRSANVASVLATYERCTAMREGLAASLSRWRRGWRRLVHPALSWCAAFDYFKQATGRTHADTLHGASMRRTDINEYRVLLKALRSADVPNWAGYLDARVRAKGWDHTTLRQGLRRVPRSLPQGHRWFLLKIHLNAPMTSARIASAGGGQIQPCLFCRAPGGDRWDHLACCGCVMSACDRLFHAGHIPALTTAYPTLMMQTDLDGATLAAVVATFAAVWRVRAACRNTSAVISHDSLYDLLAKSLECPWLLGCLPTMDKKSRRDSRVRAPRNAPDRVVYKSDGASRGQGQDGDVVAGWGAAVWAATEEGNGAGLPQATAHGHMGIGVTNNIAEYTGLVVCLTRALRRLDPQVAFYVDSMLVARQMARFDAWACRSPDLARLHSECRRLGRALDDAAVIWEVRHLYREYNQCADALANRGVDERAPWVATAGW